MEKKQEEEVINQKEGVVYETKRTEDGKPIIILVMEPMPIIPFDTKVKLIW